MEQMSLTFPLKIFSIDLAFFIIFKALILLNKALLENQISALDVIQIAKQNCSSIQIDHDLKSMNLLGFSPLVQGYLLDFDPMILDDLNLLELTIIDFMSDFDPKRYKIISTELHVQSQTVPSPEVEEKALFLPTITHVFIVESMYRFFYRKAANENNKLFLFQYIYFFLISYPFSDTTPLYERVIKYSLYSLSGSFFILSLPIKFIMMLISLLLNLIMILSPLIQTPTGLFIGRNPRRRVEIVNDFDHI